MKICFACAVFGILLASCGQDTGVDVDAHETLEQAMWGGVGVFQPGVVFLVEDDDSRCTATLIFIDALITAAHCVTKTSPSFKVIEQTGHNVYTCLTANTAVPVRFPP